jgi:uncharacterized membrane protein
VFVFCLRVVVFLAALLVCSVMISKIMMNTPTRQQEKQQHANKKQTQTAKHKNWKTNLHNLLGSAIFLWLLCANQTLAMKVFCSVQITTLL